MGQWQDKINDLMVVRESEQYQEGGIQVSDKICIFKKIRNLFRTTLITHCSSIVAQCPVEQFFSRLPNCMSL